MQYDFNDSCNAIATEIVKYYNAKNEYHEPTN